MPAVIHLTDIDKTYDSAGPPALAKVNLTVHAGDAVAVMGPSGSGKSTLLNVIAGLDRPTGGTVEVAGVRLDTLSERGLARFRREHIGIIFQFFHLLDELTVRDNVLLPAQLTGARGAQARARAAQLLDALGIARYADAYPARLSGGQRQRVAIARALMNRPALLLADEPTGAIDAAAAAGVCDLLRELNADGQTLLLVTHDPAMAGGCARRTVTMRDGSARESGHAGAVVAS
ncbi:ABC transporter ATP-binding protein [Rugosimonospora africana]|uniref:ABC transporter ATP-binding protein n=1 Tax=Rugosimonospora africana TaxID=556532 RepID=A0A8J3QSN2_9ACTN|nr:ABC transporter ATP-binding protein [Rugosimonospora africana]GIH15749.1 ABC transporter ATP-binding protein [Rugosimonospora africana]